MSDGTDSAVSVARSFPLRRRHLFRLHQCEPKLLECVLSAGSYAMLIRKYNCIVDRLNAALEFPMRQSKECWYSVAQDL